MSTEAQAKAAIEGIHQQVFDNRTVKANFATPLRARSVSRYADAEEETFKEKVITRRPRGEKSKFRMFVESRKKAKAN
jgi:hypothetical protein